MKKTVYLFLLSVLAVQLYAVDWGTAKIKNGSKQFTIAGKTQRLYLSIHPGSEKDKAKVSLSDKAVVIDLRDLPPNASACLRATLPNDGKEWACKRAEVCIKISADAPGRIRVYREGSTAEKKHDYACKDRPVDKESRLLQMETTFPENLLRSALRFDLPGGRCYYYEESFVRELPKIQGQQVDETRNWIRNGGAENDFYDTGLVGFRYSRYPDSKLVQRHRRVLSGSADFAIDRKVFHSGSASFRISAVSSDKSMGLLYWPPVPFQPGKSACFSAWIKAEKKAQITVMLFCGNGIAYQRNYNIGPEWKRYEVYIPEWGKKAPGLSKVGDVLTGYGCRLGTTNPQITLISGGTIWIDDVCYQLGGRKACRVEKELPAKVTLDNPYHYYQTGTPVKAEFKVWNNTDRKKDYAFEWQVTDFLGNTVVKSASPLKMTIPANSSSVQKLQITLPSTTRGMLRLACMPKNSTLPYGVFFGVIGPNAPMDKRIGMNYNNNGDWEHCLKLMHDFRIGGLRLWFEPKYNYRGWRSVDTFFKGGAELMMCLSEPGKEFSPGLILPKDFTPMLNKWTSFAEKYKGKIRYYEILNEPNIWRGRIRGYDTARFQECTVQSNADLIVDSAKRLKKADPNVLIAGPATCHTDLNWTENVLARGAAKVLDVITEHPYREAPECPDYEDEIKLIKSYNKQYGKKFLHAPSEAGIVCLPLFQQREDFPVSAHRQVSYMMRLMLMALANDAAAYYNFAFGPVVEGTAWHVLMQSSAENQGMPVPGPVLYACRAAADRVYGCGGAGSVHLGNDFRCYLFNSPERRVAVLWCWKNGPVPLPESNLWKKGKLYDVMGNMRSAASVKLDTMPVYFETNLSLNELKQQLQKLPLDKNDPQLIIAGMPADGSVWNVSLKNVSKSGLNGKVMLFGKAQEFRALKPGETRNFRFTGKSAKENEIITVQLNSGKKETAVLDMRLVAVPKTVKPLKIDGFLADWPENAPRLPMRVLTRLPVWEKAFDKVNAEAMTCWDDDFWYVAVRVKNKPKAYNGHTMADASSLYKFDSVQIAFDTLNNGKLFKYDDDDFEYAVGKIGNQSLVYRYAGSSTRYDSLDKSPGIVPEVLSAVVQKNGETIYEVAFPRRAVSPFRLVSGSRMRFNLLLNISGAGGRAGYLELVPGIGSKSKQPGRFYPMQLNK